MILLRFFGAFATSYTFGILFNVTKKEWFFCGLTGLLGFITLTGLKHFSANIFLATVVVTTTSIILSKIRKTISTNYLTTGIIPYVPGGALYSTMYYIALNDWYHALYAGSEAFITAAAIAFGVIVTVSIYNVLR